MKRIIFALLGLIAIVSVPVESFALFKATKFTVVVVSEEGEPLSGVKVGVGFEKNIGWGTDSAGQQGMTDGDGRLTFSGQSNGHITYGGSKDGYYPSYYDYDFKDLSTFGWEPWNPELKIEMRKIENQVPMYIRDTTDYKVEVPVVGEKIGFDLVIFDWVPPYGKGLHSDFVVRVDRYFTDVNNYEEKLEVFFKNKDDGIQVISEDFSSGSDYKLPRYAPDIEYNNYFETKSGRKNGRYYKNYNFTDNYVFRIRSETKDEIIKKALYGKIHGPFTVTGIMKKKAKIIFKYYLNPDGTRNLEHDPNRNLFYEK